MKKIIAALKANKLLKKSIVDTNYYLISQLASKLLTLLVVPILARTVSVESFGFYDAFLLYTSFLLLFATLGIDSGLGIFIVENASNDKVLKFYYTFSLAIGFASIFFVCILATIVQQFYTIIPANIFILVFINLVFGFLSYTAFNFLRWLGKSKIAAIITFISTTSGVLIGISAMLILKSNDINWFISGLISGNFISAIVCVWITKQYISFKAIDESKQKAIELLKVSLPFLPNYLANNLLLLSDRFLIMNFLNAYSYGQYSMISRIAQIPAFAVQVLNKGFLPVLFHNHNTEDGKKFNQKVLHLYILAIIPIFIFFLFSNGFLVQLFAGDKYTKVAYLVPTMMLSVLFFGSMGFNGFGFSIKRKTIGITLITFGSVLLNIVLALSFIKIYGLAAVSISIMVAAAVSSIVYTWQSEKLYKIGYSLPLMIIVFTMLSIASGIYTIFNSEGLALLLNN